MSMSSVVTASLPGSMGITVAQPVKRVDERIVACAILSLACLTRKEATIPFFAGIAVEMLKASLGKHTFQFKFSPDDEQGSWLCQNYPTKSNATSQSSNATSQAWDVNMITGERCHQQPARRLSQIERPRRRRSRRQTTLHHPQSQQNVFLGGSPLLPRACSDTSSGAGCSGLVAQVCSLTTKDTWTVKWIGVWILASHIVHCGGSSCGHRSVKSLQGRLRELFKAGTQYSAEAFLVGMGIVAIVNGIWEQRNEQADVTRMP